MGKKYKCIYCSSSYERADLVSHIERKHEDMIPQDYSANRLVFDICNGKDVGNGSGRCNICKGPTEWDEKSGRYKVYCSDECKKQMRENAKKNMIKVHGKETLLDDPEWQANHMLANRRISGKYKFKDGGYVSYTGSYEKKLLEFLDQFMDISSDDIMCPGPTIEYTYKGETKHYITDLLYFPYNLIIEVKDGGSNPNKTNMPETRAKTLAKEDAIIKMGKYNYLRLTDNNFIQLLDIFVDLKEQSRSDDPDKKINHVNEYAGISCALPRTDVQPHVYVVDLADGSNNKRSVGVTNNVIGDYMMCVDNNALKKKKLKDVKDATCDVYEYKGNNTKDLLKKLYEDYKSEKEVDDNYILELFTGHKILCDDQIKCYEYLQPVDIESKIENMRSTIATFNAEYNFVKNGNKYDPMFEVLDNTKRAFVNNLLKDRQDIRIFQDVNEEYYAVNIKTGRRTMGEKNIYNISSAMINSILV